MTFTTQRRLPAALACSMTIAVAAIASYGCSDIDEAFDCNDVCTRFADCYDIDYDTGACETRCRDGADADREYADAASACETCLDDRSCTGSFVCTDECRGVVP